MIKCQLGQVSICTLQVYGTFSVSFEVASKGVVIIASVFTSKNKLMSAGNNNISPTPTANDSLQRRGAGKKQAGLGDLKQNIK